jgi:hypothetical protein
MCDGDGWKPYLVGAPHTDLEGQQRQICRAINRSGILKPAIVLAGHLDNGFRLRSDLF